MRYIGTKRLIAVLALLCVAGAVTLAGPGAPAPGPAPSHDDRPSPEEEAFARTTSNLLHNELFAALLTEFGETTPDNVEQGKQAISLIFNNANRDIRLIGIFPPLVGGINNIPSDSFERRSMAAALKGLENDSVERVGDRWYVRRSFPLSNTFHSSCVMCHSNFANLTNPGQWVGALTIRVPIREDD
jgi:hypothetical protein